MTARISIFASLAFALAACTTEVTSTNPPDCASPTTLCGDKCVATSIDPKNCGACGAVCDDGKICVEGACADAPACPDEEIECDGACVSPRTDPNFCGASGDCLGGNAGWVCARAEVCVEGACSSTCPATQVACDGVCISPATDREHCGAKEDCEGENAGVECAAHESCVDGACKLVCPGDRIACDGACISPLTNRTFCGATGDCRGVNAGSECLAGEFCSDGACVPRCPKGELECGDVCVDPATDSNHCGASADCLEPNAGVVCTAEEACVGGACVPLVPKCESNDDCSDGVFCNGTEACDPEAPASDDFGCRPGPTPCYAWEVCDEASRSCQPG